MAVARILTRSPEDAGPLAGGLRARGYTVEIVAPDAAPRGAVELEITLEPCATADALRRAAEIAQPGGLDVFVSPATFADARIAAVPRLEAPALVTSGPAKTPQSERGRELRAVTGLAAAAVANLLGRVRELIMLAVASIGEFVHRTAARVAVRRRQRGQAHHLRQRAPKVASQARTRTAPLPVIRRTRSRERDWRATGIVSLGVAIAIAVGWAAVNRRPAAPVPTSVLMRSNAVQQQVPFGPVVLPAPVTMRVPAKTPRVAPQSGSAIRHAAPQSDFGPEVIVRHFRAGKPAPPPSPDDSGAEVVVRHFPRSGAVAKRR